MFKYTGVLKRLSTILPQYALRMIYHSIIHSHLNYHILAWGSEMQRLELSQKRIIRIIAGAGYLPHTDPLYKKLGICKLTHSHQMKLVTLYHRHFNGTVPKYFQAMKFPRHNDSHDHDTRNKYYHRVPISSNKTGRHLLSVMIPQAINEIERDFLSLLMRCELDSIVS